MDFAIGAYAQRREFMGVDSNRHPLENAWNAEWSYRSAKKAGSLNEVFSAVQPQTHDHLLGAYLRGGGESHFRYCVTRITNTLAGRFTADEAALAVGNLLIDRSFDGFKLEQQAVEIVQASLPESDWLLARRSSQSEDRQSGADILVEDVEGTVTAAFQVKPKSFLFGRSESLVRDRARLAATHEQFYESSGIRVYFLFKEDLQRGEFAPQLLTQKVGA